jgi:hypothetical protein
MVHSIELVFNRDTEATIRRIWAELAAVGIPSQAPASRPHVTLAVADQIAPDVDGLLKPVTERLPLNCTVGAALLFGRAAPGPVPNSLPGQWTAHVTLARRVGGAQLGRGLRVAGRPAQIAGSFVALRRWDGNKKAEHSIG